MCLHIYELDNDWIDYFILQMTIQLNRLGHKSMFYALRSYIGSS